MEVGKGVVKEGLIFLVIEYGIEYFKGLRNLEKISLLRAGGREYAGSCHTMESIFLNWTG